jgi:hypothetical protein
MYLIPLKATLDKYGLSEDEWVEIFKQQGEVCPICKKESKTGRYVVDHAHVKGYKKMSPEQRKFYIRGILCWWDNKQIVGRGITIEKLQNAIDYLKKAEEKLGLK